jgi:hypothetical protein
MLIDLKDLIDPPKYKTGEIYTELFDTTDVNNKKISINNYKVIEKKDITTTKDTMEITGVIHTNKYIYDANFMLIC